MWRAATPSEDSAIVEMCSALNREDPGPRPVPESHTHATLTAFREQPVRGMALVLELEGTIAGYAFLATFWSNELGGEICTLDEFYVKPEKRSKGHGRALLENLVGGKSPWSRQPVAIDLEVTPANKRARAFYESVGFTPLKNAHMRVRF